MQTDREKEENGGEKGSLLNRLLETRTIVIADEINKKLARDVMTRLILLDRESAENEILILINSHGGDADAGFAIYDMIRFIRPPVKIVCAGLAASAAVIILLAAEKENRLSLPNSRFLIHQPSTGVMGSAADIEIEASEILKFREKINQLIARETGQDPKKVEDDTKRNFWMSAEQALDYGLISKIIGGFSELS